MADYERRQQESARNLSKSHLCGSLPTSSQRLKSFVEQSNFLLETVPLGLQATDTHETVINPDS
jgi:hypothetical protein